VAPVYLDKELKGYLYIILGGENYDSLVNRLQGNHIYHLAVQSALIGLLLLLTIGIVIFYAITRPLSRLSKQVSGYGQALTGSLNEDTHRQSVAEIEALLSNMDNQSRDEVAILQNNFSSMARKIAEQMQHLQLTDQQRKELLSHLSHDLKTPIAAQRAYLETLLDDAESTKDTAQLSPQLNLQQRQQFLSSALRQCDLLANRVQEILELSRLEAGQLQLNKATIDIAELSSDLTQQLGPLARQQGVNIHFTPPPQEACVEADPALLNRLFLNLIENAIHHSVKGGNITLSIEKQGQTLRFSVLDEGRGIAADDLPYIFQAFYRGKHDLTANQHKQANQGLGLAICQRIACLHGTEITVDSTINKGSRFSVAF
jgi:signal transduction histidine kinase